MPSAENEKNIPQVQKIAVDDFCFLANKFIEQRLYDEAINIYESACRIFPESVALKINLGRVKSLSKQKIERPEDFVVRKRSDAVRRDHYNKFQGLGEVYAKMGRIISSKKVFELTKLSNPDFYLPYLCLGKIYYEDKDFTRAIKELEVCTRLNPFSEEAFNYLGLSYFYNGEFHKALIALVDALLVSGGLAKEMPSSYQQKINLVIEKIDGFTPQMRNQLIKARREKLNALYEELEKSIKEISKETKDIIFTKQEDRVVKEEDKNIFDMALELKTHLLFKSLDDDSLIKVARLAARNVFLKDDFVFREDAEVKAFYLLFSGRVEIKKKTPYGFLDINAFEKGSFFGEHDLIIGKKHWANAVSLEESHVIAIDRNELPNLFAKEKQIGIHCLWYFWKSLSFQIRESNERMKEFFEVLSKEDQKKLISEDKRKKEAYIDMTKKMEALEGKGLSPMEMRLLATFSDSIELKKGDYLFREGEQGDKLFVIIDGEMLISKTIPGIGEEALTVLKNGDFFGEMALLGDDNKRSADARANSETTRLIGIKKEALKEILSIDNESAYQFLSILCRILSFRLSEINEKIFNWKMMQGNF